MSHIAPLYLYLQRENFECSDYTNEPEKLGSLVERLHNENKEVIIWVNRSDWKFNSGKVLYEIWTRNRDEPVTMGPFIRIS